MYLVLFSSPLGAEVWDSFPDELTARRKMLSAFGGSNYISIAYEKTSNQPEVWTARFLLTSKGDFRTV